MCDLEPSTITWLEDKLIPELKTSLNKSKCKVKYETSTPTDSLFMARVIFLDLKFNDGEGKDEDEIDLVVKRPPLGTKGRDLFNLDATFHNEILFYTKYAKFYQDYPRLFYTLEKPPYDSIIVVENINNQGYHLNSEKTNLDIEYMFAAIREIAKFHTNSYVFKDKHPEEFFIIVKNIQSVRYPPSKDNPVVSKARATVPRVMKYLRKQNYDEPFCEKLEEFLLNAFSYATVELSKPVEPLATLCHGDFTSNNVFFKETNGSIQTKLIDFGMINYGSPCKDLSLFLYLSGTRSHRTDKFNEIFDLYYEALLQGLKEAGLVNLERFSKEAFLKDYKSQAFFGYFIVSLFLPVMLGYFGNDSSAVLKIPSEELCQIFDVVGGDEFTKILVDMILDLRKAGCLNHIMNM